MEANDLLENGKVDGILEEMFAGIEFIKWKSGSGLSISHTFEAKQGYGIAIKKRDFGLEIPECVKKVVEFVSGEILTNASRILKSDTVRVFYNFVCNKFIYTDFLYFRPRRLEIINYFQVAL